MKRRIANLLTTIAGLAGLILASTDTLAQNEDPDPGAMPTRYEVEIIIFRHLDQSRNTPEIPAAASMVQDSPFNLSLAERPIEQGAPAVGNTASEWRTSSTADDDEFAGDADRQPFPGRPGRAVSFLLMSPRAEFPDFLPVDEGSFALNGMFKRIVRLDAYEPLLHLGWIQPAKNTEEAMPYQIATQSDTSAGITGTVTLYKERYLHLALNLALESTRPDEVLPPAAEMPPERVFGLNTFADTNESTEQTSAMHKLQQSRRIRLSNTHYFDHPLFGVIATVNRIKTASDADNARPGAGG